MAGMDMGSCEGLLEIFTNKKLELIKILETSKVVQRAKFQARFNYTHERVLRTHQQNQSLHEMKIDIEREYLRYVSLNAIKISA